MRDRQRGQDANCHGSCGSLGERLGELSRVPRTGQMSRPNRGDPKERSSRSGHVRAPAWRQLVASLFRVAMPFVTSSDARSY